MSNIYKHCVKQIDVYHGDDDRFIKDVLQKREYSYYPLDEKNDLIVIDAGANIGTFTWSILDKVKTAYLVEPVKQCVDLIQQTIKENNINNVSVYEFALGNSNGRRGFHNTEDSHTGSSSFSGGNNCTVLVKDLHTFMNEENIEKVDLMKVDIENAELELFESEGFAKVSQRIMAIIGERHGKNNIKDPLERNGYTYKNHGSHFVAEKL